MKMNKYLEKIEGIIFKEKFTVRPNHLTYLFDLHIKQSQFLLESLAKKHKNELIVKYGLYGHQGEASDEIGARRFMVVEQDDVENEKKNFTKLISCTIKSVKQKHNELDIDYPIEKMITSKEDLISYQKKGFCVNENSSLREDKLDELLKRLGVSKNKSTKLNGFSSTPNSIKIKSTDSPISSQESKTIVKAIKPELKSKDLFASFKNKPKQEPKEEIKKEIKEELKKEVKDELTNKNVLNNGKNDVKNLEESDKLKKDKSSKKDDKKLKRVIKAADSSEEEMMSDLEDIDMDFEDEPIQKSKNSQQIKRSSTFDSDSDEDFGHSKENFKHKNKKQRKRVIDFDDSSEESNDHKNGTIESKFEVTTKTAKESTSSRLVEKEETFVDEDGFKVTRQVKTIVKDEKKVEPKIKTEAKKSGPTTLGLKKPDPKPSKPAAKNQTSIMSFFKRKN